MEITELRKELHEYINLADERFLKMVHAMSKEYGKSEIVGYKPNGTPISEEELRKRARAASMRVKSGDFIAQEIIDKEIFLLK